MLKIYGFNLEKVHIDNIYKLSGKKDWIKIGLIKFIIQQALFLWLIMSPIEFREIR